MVLRRFVLALSLLFTLSLTARTAMAAELTLRVVGLRPTGQVSVAIFDSRSSWDQRSAARRTLTAAVTQGAVRMSFDLPPGAYGVMAYHDRNLNGRLDTLPIGLPTEPYGFSNNSRGTFGPPMWRKASFQLPETGAQIELRLR